MEKSDCKKRENIFVRICNSYKALNAPVKMSFWFLMCSFLQKGISMLTMPVFTRIMVDAEYGRYSLFVSWSSFFSTIFSLNLAGGFYLKELVINDSDKDGFTSSMIGLTGTSCFAGLIVYWIFSKELNEITGLTNLLVISAFVQIFFTTVYSFWMNRLRLDYKYRKIIIMTAAAVILRPLLSLLLVFSAETRLQTEARAAAETIIDVALYSILLISILKRGRVFFRKDYWKKAILFSLPLIPHYLSKIVLNQADRIMIGSYCGLAEAGYYSAAYSLAAIMLIFNQAVSASLIPWLYKSIKNKSFDTIKAVSNKIVAVIMLLNLMTVAAAPELFRIVAPSNYYSAIWIIPPVTVSTFFIFMYDLFTAFQYYFSKTKWVMAVSVTGAILNIVLNMIFIPKFGFTAAGYTTLVCYILYGILHYCFMRKVCNEFLDGCRVYDIKKIFLFGLTLIIGAGIMMLLYPYPAVRYAVLAILLLLVIIKRKKLLTAIKELRQK